MVFPNEGYLCLLAHQGMFHAVASPFKDQKMPMVDQTVYHCRSHLFICKNTSPFGEFQICGQDQALALLTVGYDPEQQLGAILVDRDIPPFIKDQQIQFPQLH